MKFYLYNSDKPEKKYYIQFINPETGRSKKIYFGAAGMSDYILSGGDEEKKQRYLKRHSAMKGEQWNNPFKASFYATNLLWNKSSLSASIKDTNERYGIKIINKTMKTGGEKNSAYRSMKLAASEGKTKPTTKQNDISSELIRWSNEKWQNLTAKLTDGDKFYDCGKKGKKQIALKLPSVCRPTIKINKDTPTLAKEYTKKQIEKAIKLKKKGKRIMWNEL